MNQSLSISLVVFRSDETLLIKTLQSLSHSVQQALITQRIDCYQLDVIDNNANGRKSQTLEYLVKCYWQEPFKLIAPDQNLGYGIAHNQSILSRQETFHLIINPDVEVDRDAISMAVDYLNQHAEVGLVTPNSQQPDGRKDYLCKSYPSVWVLFLRGFAPKIIKKLFQSTLNAYENHQLTQAVNSQVMIASGCFMFCQGSVLRSIQGFSQQFFLYFEDFDLSLRLTKYSQITYLTEVKIIHYGGQTAKKGLWHIKLFCQSAWQFFNLHGWRFI